MDIETAYGRLPVWIQNTFCAIEGLRVRRQRLGGGFAGLLQVAQERSAWSPEQVAAYRDKRLHAYVQHCAATVPYYRRRFREWGLDPREIRTLSDLAQVPVLTKDEAQTHIAELASEAVRPSACVRTHTSGTTGGGLKFRVCVDAVREQWAVWWRYRGWHGLDPTVWCGYFGGRPVVPIHQRRPPFWRLNVPGRQVLFSGYHLNEESFQAYAAEIRRRRLPWLHGYPSLLSLLAAYVLEKGFDLGYTPQWITTGAENLLPQQSDRIERAFGVRPIQHYGLAELAANVSECPLGSLHVDEDFAAVELLDPEPSGSCRVVGTTLANLATPLLRYDVGDLATPCPGTCPCGRPGRLVRELDGRREDYVLLANGTRIGRLDHVFKDQVRIREAQLLQRRAGAVVVRVVPTAGYGDNDERRLMAELAKRLGMDTSVTIEYTGRLNRSRTGKLRLVVSEIEGGILEREPPALPVEVSTR